MNKKKQFWLMCIAMVIVVVAGSAFSFRGSVKQVNSVLLRQAICSGNVEIIATWLKQGNNPSTFFDGYNTPLTTVGGIKCGVHLPVVKFLISKGADVQKVNRRGYSPIMLASVSCNVQLIRIFHENGADINSRSSEGLNLLTGCQEEMSKKRAVIYVSSLFDMGLKPYVAGFDLSILDWRLAKQHSEVRAILKKNLERN